MLNKQEYFYVHFLKKKITLVNCNSFFILVQKIGRNIKKHTDQLTEGTTSYRKLEGTSKLIFIAFQSVLTTLKYWILRIPGQSIGCLFASMLTPCMCNVDVKCISGHWTIIAQVVNISGQKGALLPPVKVPWTWPLTICAHIFVRLASLSVFC